jgi:ribosomal protein S7
LDIGSNKRYAKQIDQQMTAHVDQMVMRGAPETLSDRELELDVQPLVKAATPVFARAWVRYGGVAVHIDVEAVAWTPQAVAIRWLSPDGQQHRAWVWVSAVKRHP